MTVDIPPLLRRAADAGIIVRRSPRSRLEIVAPAFANPRLIAELRQHRVAIDQHETAAWRRRVIEAAIEAGRP